MKIIVPMAGMGKRMRPHTLTTPKPLLPIAGKPIVNRLVEDIAARCDEKIEEVAFIIGDFGKKVEQDLLDIATKIGAKGSIYHQLEPLGTAHAILCAKESLEGHLIVAFADTLFQADFKLNVEEDGIIWTNKIDDPSAFGVVETDNYGVVQKFWEKPKEFISDEAIIGIYYFKDGNYLKNELQYLIDHQIIVKGEYQLTDALENMKTKGSKFKTASVTHWLDCGNKDSTISTNTTILELDKNAAVTSISANIKNSVVIQPSFVGENVEIENSVIGPNVSIGNGTKIEDSRISDSIINENVSLKNIILHNSMVGLWAKLEGNAESISVSDFSEWK